MFIKKMKVCKSNLNYDNVIIITYWVGEVLALCRSFKNLSTVGNGNICLRVVASCRCRVSSCFSLNGDKWLFWMTPVTDIQFRCFE